MFGEGKDVMRVRRVRWIAIGTAIFTVVATLALGASAFASQDTSRCAPPVAGGQPPGASVHTTAAHDSSWRTGAFKAVGCRAWRHMHHNRRTLTRTGLLH